MTPDTQLVARRVLVVEDEKHQRTMLQRAVSEFGFEVTAAASAEEALPLIESDPPTIAMLDLNLPGMSGLELAARLQERSPATRILILTGYGDLEAAREAIRLDVVDFLLKPCPLVELEGAVDRAYRKASESAASSARPPAERATRAGPKSIDDAERELIRQALARHEGNRTKAAAELGISVRTLYYRLSRYEVEDRRPND